MSYDDKLTAEDKLAAEEARRAGQHGAVRSFVEREVGAEVAAEASIPTATEIRREERVAAELRRKALRPAITGRTSSGVRPLPGVQGTTPDRRPRS